MKGAGEHGKTFGEEDELVPYVCAKNKANTGGQNSEEKTKMEGSLSGFIGNLPFL